MKVHFAALDPLDPSTVRAPGGGGGSGSDNLAKPISEKCHPLILEFNKLKYYIYIKSTL